MTSAKYIYLNIRKCYILICMYVCMQMGFRMFSARPIFSEANLNCEKHKMERFFLVSSCVVHRACFLYLWTFLTVAK